jgi:diguanylate cyclase (GGDEF)-like protein/putative nucleotidyltransferase with HDIG domain
MGLIPMGGSAARTYGVGSASVEVKGGPGHGSHTGAVARGQSLVAMGAAVVGLLGILLPHPASFWEPGLVAVQLTAVIPALWLYAHADDVPAWVLNAMPAYAVVLTSGAVISSGSSTSGYELFYVWVALITFYFLSRRETLIQIGWAILNYAVVIAILGPPAMIPGPGEEVHRFVLIAGTLIAAAVPLLYLRGRFDDLLKRLSDAARTDLLTGLRNVRGLHEVLSAELERARLSSASVSVLVADLDRFREVNDQFGHSSGDELLRRIGALFDGATRRMDAVARSGAAEFTIVLPEAGEGDAYLVAEQLLGRVRRGFRDEFVALTTSIGIATYPRDAVSAEELLKLASESLSAAQVLGGDRAVVSSAEVPNVLAGVERRRPEEGQAHLATMLSLAEAIDLRDNGTARHSEIVGHLAQAMARELGLPEQRVQRVRLAGILHDIGKIAISDSILGKPGPLDEHEWEEVRRHPELGARILGSRELVDIREWVMASHERPDGTGYPRGLRGEEIPMEARILAVADAYQAMTGDRVYRPAMSDRAARDELRACAGTQFDPEVVEALLRALDREGVFTR